MKSSAHPDLSEGRLPTFVGKSLHAFLRRRMSRLPSVPLFAEPLRSMAAIELTRMGDLVAAIHTVGALRRALPDTEIALLTRDRYASVAAGLLPGVQVKGIRESSAASMLLHARNSVRSLAPALSVSMSVSRLNALTALVSGSPRIAGYLAFEGTRAPYLYPARTECFGFPASLGHVQPARLSARPAAILEMLGLSHLPVPGGLTFNQEVLAAVRARIASERITGSRPYVLLHPYSGWRFRNWPLRSFRECIERLVGESSADVVVVVEEQHREDALQLFTHLGSPGNARLFVSGDLMLTAVLIHDAALYIGNDSGPLHFAAGFGVPAIGLYGPASPEATGPVPPGGASFKTLYHQFPCSPCDQESCPHGERWCMSKISVDDVVRTALQLLSSHRSVKATHA